MTNGYHYNNGWPQPLPSSYYLSYQQSGSPPNPNAGNPTGNPNAGNPSGQYMDGKGDPSRTPRLMGYAVPNHRSGRGRDGKDLIQCPTPGCDGMGHVSGNYATHRR